MSFSGDCHVRKWHPKTGFPVATLQSGHFSVITCMCGHSWARKEGGFSQGVATVNGDGEGGEDVLFTGSVKGRIVRWGVTNDVIAQTYVGGGRSRCGLVVLFVCLFVCLFG